MKSYLCVGGPHAGQKYDTRRDHFTVPIRTYEAAELEGPFNIPINGSVSVKTVTYREETFQTAQGWITFWVPEGQTWFETMTLLLEGYELMNAATNEVARQKAIINNYEADRLGQLTAKDMGQP